MRKVGIVTACVLVLTGCSKDQPSEEEIKNALTIYTEKKGCASSVLFKEIPINLRYIKNNQNIIKIFVNAGLLEKTDDSYTLTALGKEAYDPSMNGFCYTDSYKINSVKVEKEDANIPSTLSGAWYVSLNISPSQVSDWVKNEELINAASRLSEKDVESPKTYTVRLGKKIGVEELVVIEPRFSFEPGLKYNMGW
ncbi:hypothetical protein [Shewanella sp. YIC-542]|uniref:hypothetical protein n=1 Tax=Shewanella mytili TaxID=3377111 RepID=UPI00398E5D93